MASKKLPSVFHMFLVGIFTLCTLQSSSQSGIYDVYDSSVISSKNMAQQNDFWNNTQSFPAKPRNQWEIGLKGGMFTISGDVPSRMPTFGGSFTIRKAIGYLFSIRGQYVYGIAKGLNWRSSENYAKNPAWAGYNPRVRSATGLLTTNTGGPVMPVFYNYRSRVHDFSLQGLFAFNNIRFHKQKTSVSLYGGLGIGMTAFKTNVNARNSSGQTYSALFASIPAADQTNDNKKKVLDRLKEGMDDTYETAAQAQGTRRDEIGSRTLRPSGHFIGGVSFKLSRRINLAIEEKYTVIKDDYLDGQIWQEHAQGDAVLTSDFDSYNFASIGLNFNIGANRVEPLWWINPLDYAYSELNNPRHMKLPKPILDDTDGDGVIDQLDKEPNTPAGCPVDTHGVSRDTDGDGVVDCKDKELNTPTYCQPVDADGVGKCPEPECCKNAVAPLETACAIGDLPSISLRGNSSTLTSDAKAMLATIASKLKSSANCNISITGYPATSKASQSLCNKRTEAIKQYLMEQEGISSDRITTNCEIGGGDANTIDIRSVNK
jgi:hypothetical protein